MGEEQFALDSKQPEQFLCELAHELWPMVGHDAFEEAITSPDIVNEELHQLLRGTLLCHQSEDDLLAEMVNNGEDGIIPVRDQEIGHEVSSKILPWSCQDREGFEQPCLLLIITFKSGAGLAPLDVFPYVPLKSFSYIELL